MGREGGLSVVCAATRCLYLRFLFRADSLPLASEALPDPGRLRLFEDAVFFMGLGCLLDLPDGVFAPEGFLDPLFVLPLS